MTTDEQMREARLLALEKAATALKTEGAIRSANITTRPYNAEEGRGLSPSPKCAIDHIVEALEAVLQGNGAAPHHACCRTQHEGRA